MWDIMQYDFMQNAFAAAILVSVACGIIGSLVVVKKITYIGGGIAHAAFGGIGLGYFLGVNPLICVMPFSIGAALLIAFVKRKWKIAEDTIIGMMWAVGMALGVLFIGLTPGYAPDLFSYLFGNILTVPRGDLALMVVLDLVILASVSALYREFMAIAFDEEYAECSGLPVTLLYIIFLCLVALTVVMLVRIVGIVLVIAPLTMPASIAKQWTSRLLPMMCVASIVGVILTVSGLLLSYHCDIASGATIILLSGSVFIGSSIAKGLIRKKK